MKETTKRLLLIIIPIFLVISCILSVAGSVGGYWYYLNTKMKAQEAAKKAQEQAVRKTDQDFWTGYVQWQLSRNKLWPIENEIAKLEKEYSDTLRVQRNEASFNRNNAEVLRLCDLFKANLDNKEKAYGKMQAQLSDESASVTRLNELAQQLSSKEKRGRAFKIVSLAREANNLTNEAVSLWMADIAIDGRINELYVWLANGHIGVSGFNDELTKHQADSDTTRQQAAEKDRQASHKRDQIEDEWAKLKPFLKR